MRTIILFILISMTFSCQSELDENKHAFQSILGENKINAINSLGIDFENNLKNNYPKLTIDKAYEQYLIEIISNSTNDLQKFKFQSPNTQKELIESGLCKELYLKNNHNELEINETGQYMKALEYIAKSDEFVKNYYVKRRAAGILPNKLVVNGILSSNPNFYNYFHKRIVVLEFTF